MAEYEMDNPYPSEPPDSALWGAGLIFFGSMMMLLLGSFHVIVGFAALINDEFYAVRPGFALEMDVAAWGWSHMLGGILVMITGVGLLTGATLARMLAIFFVVVSMVWNFYSIPYYPIWSVLMIGMCLVVLWALLAHGREFTEMMTDDSAQ